MTLLAISDLKVAAGARILLEIPEISLGAGEFLAVLGPTASGKSTLLRALHGIERPRSGHYSWRGTPVGTPFSVELARRITMVFQDPMLLSGTVLFNVALGLRFRGIGRPEASRRARLALQSLGVEHLADRGISGLSGGEAQRVALARALAVEPELLLLDEPLASLDLNTRDQVRAELLRILRERHIACVWVTHDQDEARIVGDRVAVLDAGRMLQVGPSEEVFHRPATIRVAEIVRTRNLLPGYAADGAVALGSHRLPVPSTSCHGPVTVCVRPEEIELSSDGGLRGTVAALRPAGSMHELVVDCGGGVELVALTPRRTVAALGLAPGGSVSLDVPPAALHLLPRSDGVPEVAPAAPPPASPGRSSGP